MKLIDAIRNVIRPVPTHAWEFSPPDEAITESLGISGTMYFFPDELRERLKAYPIFNWQCTDEHVGLDALYLDGEPVGCTYRSARKNPYEVEWLSVEIAAKVRQVILSYAAKEHQPALVDPEQDIGEDFRVHFVGQPLTKDAFFEGRPVTIVGGYDIMSRDAPKYGDPNYNKFIVLDQGEERTVAPGDLHFAFNVKPLAVGTRVIVATDIHKGKTGTIIEHDPNAGHCWLVQFDNRAPDAKEFEGKHWHWPFELQIIG